MSDQIKSKGNQRVGFYIAIVIAAIAVVVAIFFAVQAITPSSEARDPNAALGQLENKSQEEIQDELNRIVEEGMFNISIAAEAHFADGSSEGDLRIENIPSNHYLMKVQITRDDTDEIIYTTGLIEPNHHIQAARLDVDLDAGEYPCTAVFSAYDTETEKQVGQAAAKVNIVVEG